MNNRNALINAVNLCLNGKKVLPQTEKVNPTELLRMAKSQSLVNIVACGLKKDGSYTEQELHGLNEAGKLATFQYLRQEQELQRLRDALEERNLRFVLLKGSRMRQFYPSPELRSSCDIDILTEAPDEVILEIMDSLGYTYEKDGGTTLNFFLHPLVSVEMHRYLFDDGLAFHGFFDTLWERIIPSKDGSCECFLTEEDFYIYMIAHLVKHFTRYGCGLRPLLDVYIYEHSADCRCDFEAADHALEKLGLLYFTKQIRGLLDKWFEKGTLSVQDEELTDYIISSGIYGTNRSTRAHQYRRAGSYRIQKLHTLISHVFPPLHAMRSLYPRLLRCPLLLPVAWFARAMRICFKGREKAKKTYQEIQSVDEAYVNQLTTIMKRLRLEPEREEKQ